MNNADNGISHWREVVSRPLNAGTFWPLSSEVRVEVAAASAYGKVHHNTDHYLAIRLGRLQETLIFRRGSKSTATRCSWLTVSARVPKGRARAASR